MLINCSFIWSATLFIVLVYLNYSTGSVVDYAYSVERSNASASINITWIQAAVIPPYLQAGLIHGVLDLSSTQQFYQNLFIGVNQTCSTHVLEWLVKLNNLSWENVGAEENKWALQMADSWGKIPEGVLTGHTNSYGDFDECVQMSAGSVAAGAQHFDGLYCTSYALDYQTAMAVTPVPPNFQNENLKSFGDIPELASLEKFLKTLGGSEKTAMPLIPSLGVCFPNSCSQQEVQQILVNALVILYYAKIPDVDPTTLPWPVTNFCTDRHKPELNAGAIVVIVVVSAIVTLVLISTLTDYWISEYLPERKVAKSTAFKYLMAFSIYTNVPKIVSTKRSGDDLSCLHGIRFFSTVWVVLAHTYGAYLRGPIWNRADVDNVYKDWKGIPVINATFSVDTFFVMGGTLTAYMLLKTLQKTKGKINVPMMYLHRFIRLTPTYAIVVAIYTTLLNYFGNGPVWNSYWDLELGFCYKNWWTNLLYVSTIVNTREMCIGESWYLSNDMQYFVLSPFIVYPLWKWPAAGTLLLVIYTVLSIVSQVLVLHFANEVPPAMLFTRPEIAGLGTAEIYVRPWTRISPFLVGIWLGLLLYKTRDRAFKLPKILVYLFCLVSTVGALSILFGIFPWFNPNNSVPVVSSYFYTGLSRFSWGVCIAWVIFACIKGYGGIVNRFLSWKAFMPLGRLCFCVYLTSRNFQNIFHFRLSVPLKWDTYTAVNLYFAHLVMSFLGAFIFSLFFEAPFINLQKLVFNGRDKNVTPKREKQKEDFTNYVNEERNK